MVDLFICSREPLGGSQLLHGRKKSLEEVKERELLGLIYVTRYGCHLHTLHLILLAIFWVVITPSVTPEGHLDLKNTTFFEMVLK